MTDAPKRVYRVTDGDDVFHDDDHDTVAQFGAHPPLTYIRSDIAEEWAKRAADKMRLDTLAECQSQHDNGMATLATVFPKEAVQDAVDFAKEEADA